MGLFPVFWRGGALMMNSGYGYFKCKRSQALLLSLVLFALPNMSFGWDVAVCPAAPSKGYIVDNTIIKPLDIDCEDDYCGILLSAPLNADDREFWGYVLYKMDKGNDNPIMQFNLSSTIYDENMRTSLHGTRKQMKGVEVHVIYERIKDCSLHSIWKFDYISQWPVECAGIDGREKTDHLPFHEAMCNGKAEAVKLLVSKGANINAVDKYGRTPLHLVARNGHVETAKLLIAQGANIGAMSKYGRTPLHLAARKGHAKVAMLLIAKGADIDAIDKNGDAPLHLAAFYGRIDTIKALIAKGADTGLKDMDQNTPLHQAALRGQAETVRLFIAYGADINLKNQYEYTPLHYAARGGYMDVIKVLVAEGADISAKNMYGETPLHIAVDKGHAEIVDFLMNSGARSKP